MPIWLKMVKLTMLASYRIPYRFVAFSLYDTYTHHHRPKTQTRYMMRSEFALAFRRFPLVKNNSLSSHSLASFNQFFNRLNQIAHSREWLWAQIFVVQFGTNKNGKMYYKDWTANLKLHFALITICVLEL